MNSRTKLHVIQKANALIIEEDKGEPVYKYICSHCGGIAYYADQIELTHPVRNCISCHYPMLDFVAKSHFIELSKKELEQFKYE